MKPGPKPIPLAERFWRSVDIRGEDECWPWLLFCGDGGHGRFKKDGRKVNAHTVAYELTNGPIAPGALICHTCDNPPCCNPKHLYSGTKSSNAIDLYTRHGTAHLLRATHK